MTAAATLIEAAYLAQDNLFTLWQADTLSAQMVSFANDISTVFPDNIPNNRPLSNWVAIIAAFAPTVNDFENGGQGVGNGSLTTYQQSVDYIYRVCKFGSAYRDLNLITAAQATALLAAYNARFG